MKELFLKLLNLNFEFCDSIKMVNWIPYFDALHALLTELKLIVFLWVKAIMAGMLDSRIAQEWNFPIHHKMFQGYDKVSILTDGIHVTFESMRKSTIYGNENCMLKHALTHVS